MMLMITGIGMRARKPKLQAADPVGATPYGIGGGRYGVCVWIDAVGWKYTTVRPPTGTCRPDQVLGSDRRSLLQPSVDVSDLGQFHPKRLGQSGLTFVTLVAAGCPGPAD